MSKCINYYLAEHKVDMSYKCQRYGILIVFGWTLLVVCTKCLLACLYVPDFIQTIISNNLPNIKQNLAARDY